MPINCFANFSFKFKKNSHLRDKPWHSHYFDNDAIIAYYLYNFFKNRVKANKFGKHFLKKLRFFIPFADEDNNIYLLLSTGTKAIFKNL